MGRAPRIDIADYTYHVINRTNGRQLLFRTHTDYFHFETLLRDAVERTDMRLLAYVVMPNHWHLLLLPRQDGDLSAFMQWLTLTHTQQYHARKHTIGHGHLYQGRYKSFLVEQDDYFLAVVKYIERNPVRAKLAKMVEEWKWGSGYRRVNNTDTEKRLIADPPTALPHNYRAWINEPDKDDDLTLVRTSVNKGKPFGTMRWTEQMVERFSLELTTKERGRPRKGT